MQIWMSAEVDHRVGDELRRARSKVESEWNALIAGRTYETDVVKWAVVIILREKIPKGWGEIQQMHWDAKVAEFRVIVDYPAFRAASPDKQVSLVAGAVLRTLDRAVEIGVSDSGITALKEDLARYAREREWVA